MQSQLLKNSVNATFAFSSVQATQSKSILCSIENGVLESHCKGDTFEVAYKCDTEDREAQLSPVLVDAAVLQKISNAVSGDISVSQEGSTVEIKGGPIHASIQVMAAPADKVQVDVDSDAAISISVSELKSIWSNAERVASEAAATSEAADTILWEVRDRKLFWYVSDGRVVAWEHVCEEEVDTDKTLSGVIACDHVRAALKSIDKIASDYVQLNLWGDDKATGILWYDDMTRRFHPNKAKSYLYIRMSNKKCKYFNVHGILKNNEDRKDCVTVPLSALKSSLKVIGSLSDAKSHIQVHIHDDSMTLTSQSKGCVISDTLGIQGNGREYKLYLAYGVLDRAASIFSGGKDSDILFYAGDGSSPVQISTPSDRFIAAVVKM